MRKISAALFAVVVVMSAGPAKAGDAEATALLQQAKDLYAKRETLANVDAAIAKLNAAKATAKSDMLKYEVLTTLAKNLYYKGVETRDTLHNTDAALDLFQQGQDTADAATDITEDYADSYYFAALNLARWGETKGVSASTLLKLPGLLKRLKAANTLAAVDGSDGVEIDGYGPARILGRTRYKIALSGLPGGDMNESEQLLREASTKAYSVALNTVYLAETLFARNKKPEGCQKLAALLANNVETFNVDRLPETRKEFQLAREAQHNGGCL